jgi:hypothetical protein
VVHRPGHRFVRPLFRHLHYQYLRSTTPGQQDVTIWTSANGSSWTRSQLSGLSVGGIHQLTALAPAGTSVTGITSTVTAQTQQPVVLTLPAR